MPQASLQAFSILGDGVLAGALKKGASAKGLDALLGGNAKTGNSELFGKLLSGIHKAKNADAVSAILTDAPVEIKGVDIVLGPILEMLPAELAAVLKKLNIVALKNVPPQIAAMFTPAQTAPPP